jgi:hypothetical protein
MQAMSAQFFLSGINAYLNPFFFASMSLANGVGFKGHD